MIALLIAAAVVAAQPAPPPGYSLPFDELPPQTLSPQSCAMFLWDRASRRRIVMASAAPASIRVVIGGREIVLPATAVPNGPAVMGFAPHSVYGDATWQVALDLAIVAGESGAAVIRDGIVTVSRAGGDAVVAPVAGIVGCNQ